MPKIPNKETGAEGEDMAAAWLTGNGFRILERNWRSGRFEIDIVAEKEGRLHFIEVKTRRTANFGHPEEQVGKRKLQHMIEAGTLYIDQYPDWRFIRYDILAIKLYKGQSPEFLLIEDVYI
jgi:putative endonuclease